MPLITNVKNVAVKINGKEIASYQHTLSDFDLFWIDNMALRCERFIVSLKKDDGRGYGLTYKLVKMLHDLKAHK